MGVSTFDEVSPGVYCQNLDDTNWSAGVALVPTDDRAQRIDTMMICNSDTIDHNVGFYFDLGSGNHHFGYVLVPAGAGAPTVPAVDALAALLPSGSNGILVPRGVQFGFAIYEAVTTATKVEVTAIGGYLT